LQDARFFSGRAPRYRASCCRSYNRR